MRVFDLGQGLSMRVATLRKKRGPGCVRGVHASVPMLFRVRGRSLGPECVLARVTRGCAQTRFGIAPSVKPLFGRILHRPVIEACQSCNTTHKGGGDHDGGVHGAGDPGDEALAVRQDPELPVMAHLEAVQELAAGRVPDGHLFLVERGHPIAAREDLGVQGTARP